MVLVPENRVPTHPGEILLEEFLKPMKLTQRELATALHVPYQRVNELVNGRRGITPSTALRLARYFDGSPLFWLNLQLRSGICITPCSQRPGSWKPSSLGALHLKHNRNHDLAKNRPEKEIPRLRLRGSTP